MTLMKSSAATASKRPYKGLKPDERVAQRRRQILDAGLELFGRRGYQATTMAMISAESGVPHRYLTRIFAHKEDILEALYLGITSEVEQTVRADHARTPRAPADLIRQRASVACRAFLADPRKTRINCIEVVGVSARFEQLRRDMMHAFCELILEDIARLIRAGEIPDGDYQYGVMGLAGAFHELMTEWVLTPAEKRVSPDTLAGEIARFFWGALLAIQHPMPR